MSERSRISNDLTQSIAAQATSEPEPLAGVLRMMCTSKACAYYGETGPDIGKPSDISGRALVCRWCSAVLEAVRTAS